MATLQLGHQLGKTPRNKFTDFAWVSDHWNDLLATYGEVSILVFKEEVIGAGATYEEAIADARNRLPNTDEVITPIHQWLYDRRRESVKMLEIKEFMHQRDNSLNKLLETMRSWNNAK